MRNNKFSLQAIFSLFSCTTYGGGAPMTVYTLRNQKKKRDFGISEYKYMCFLPTVFFFSPQTPKL